jgi:hypothetical protein
MPGVFKKSLGEMLLEHGIIERSMLDEAMTIQKKSGKKLGKILQEKGYLSEETLYTFLEKQIGVHFRSAIEAEPDKEVFRFLNLRYCRDKSIAPVKMTGKTIKVFISEPTNTAMINEISFMTRKVVDIDYATEGAILEFLDRAAEGGGGIPARREAVREEERGVLRGIQRGRFAGRTFRRRDHPERCRAQRFGYPLRELRKDRIPEIPHRRGAHQARGDRNSGSIQRSSPASRYFRSWTFPKNASAGRKDHDSVPGPQDRHRVSSSRRSTARTPCFVSSTRAVKP